MVDDGKRIMNHIYELNFYLSSTDGLEAFGNIFFSGTVRRKMLLFFSSIKFLYMY